MRGTTISTTSIVARKPRINTAGVALSPNATMETS